MNNLLNDRAVVICKNSSYEVARNLGLYIYSKLCDCCGHVGRCNTSYEEVVKRIPCEATIGGRKVNFEVIRASELTSPIDGAIFIGYYHNELRLARMDGKPTFTEFTEHAEDFSKALDDLFTGSGKIYKDHSLNEWCWAKNLLFSTGGSPSSWGTIHELSVEEFFNR